MIRLDLPEVGVPDRVSINLNLQPGETCTGAELDGPGCIRHLFVVPGGHPNAEYTPKERYAKGRKVIIRIYFDGEPEPSVESPVGDFFGVMHGENWYPIDNHYLSVKAWNGYNCYFPMPFARHARIEFESAEEQSFVILQVDWDRYPESDMREPSRFCARWRREMPTERYGEDFLMLDADGPGCLIGFVYGVRLLDDVDRWSHGGSDNIYIDGEGSHPAYLRGIGGEDTFGEGYGGALHPPETHHYAAMPYYVHEDVGQARVAHRVVGYRFFEPDTIPFSESIHMRFGCMSNDICSTVYWYQGSPVRPFFRMPDWSQLLPGAELPRKTCDLPLPTCGEWWLCGPFGNEGDCAMKSTLIAESEVSPTTIYEGVHEAESAWLTEGSRELGRDAARWVKASANHGFVDFNHVFRPFAWGVGKTHPGVAIARCALNVLADTVADLRFAWDDDLVVSVNGKIFALGQHRAFRTKTVQVQLKAGANTVLVKLSNTVGSNHGGWAFAFLATTANGEKLLPALEQPAT